MENEILNKCKDAQLKMDIVRKLTYEAYEELCKLRRDHAEEMGIKNDRQTLISDLWDVIFKMDLTRVHLKELEPEYNSNPKYWNEKTRTDTP